jgi:hypothetical protein
VGDEVVAEEGVDEDRGWFADEGHAFGGEVELGLDVGGGAGDDAAAAEGGRDRAVDVARDDAFDLG